MPILKRFRANVTAQRGKKKEFCLVFQRNYFQYCVNDREIFTFPLILTIKYGPVLYGSDEAQSWIWVPLNTLQR